MKILLFILGWIVVSLVVSIVLGRCIAVGSGTDIDSRD